MHIDTLHQTVYDTVVDRGITDLGFTVIVVAGRECRGGEQKEEEFFHNEIIFYMFIFRVMPKVRGRPRWTNSLPIDLK